MMGVFQASGEIIKEMAWIVNLVSHIKKQKLCNWWVQFVEMLVWLLICDKYVQNNYTNLGSIVLHDEYIHLNL